MARKNKLIDFAMWLVGTIIAFGLAGLFWNGTMLNTPILSWLPLWVHQLVAILSYLATGIAVSKKIL